MLSIEEGIYALLTTNVAVAAIVGTRVYPKALPQDVTLPAITYDLITPQDMTSHSGMDGTAFPHYQITGWAETPDAVRDLMKAVRICMNGYKGTITVGASSIVIQSCLLSGGVDDSDPETQRHMRAQDYTIYHAEDIT